MNSNLKDMVVLDWSSVALTIAMGVFTYDRKLEPNKLSSYIIQRTRGIIKDYSNPSASIIIGVDKAPYWRKSIFPYYKANRKVKSESEFPFTEFFNISNSILEALKNNTDWKVIVEQGAEADDVCAACAKILDNESNLLIVSSDHDVTQVIDMYPNKNIKQYSMRRKTLISSSTYCKAEHILKGDAGDGLPAYSQPDDIFINPPIEKKRRKSITKSVIDSYKILGHEQFKIEHNLSQYECERLDMNRQIVCFDFIPDELMSNIITSITSDSKNITRTFEQVLNNDPIMVFMS